MTDIITQVYVLFHTHFPEILWDFFQMKWHGPERECWRVYMVDISAERIKVNAYRLYWLSASC